MTSEIRDHVFISYSHKDQLWLEQLRTMLKPFVRQGNLTLWDDKKLHAGDNWRTGISSALEKASVGVMLVSPDFLASDFINEVELPSLLKAASNGGLKVCWILISSCLYETSGLIEFQAAHDISEPLDSMNKSKLNNTLANVARQIKQLLDSSALIKQPSYFSPAITSSPRKVAATHLWREFFVGDRVRIFFWGGILWKKDTGMPYSVHAESGRTGTILSGDGKIVRVQWDEQMWSAAGLLVVKGKKVKLKSFVSTIARDYLKVMKS